MRTSTLTVLFLGAVLAGCSSPAEKGSAGGTGGEEEPEGGTGGAATPTGGKVGTGGSPATGGAPGTGGSVSTGGSDGTGGIPGTGGAPATGGMTGTGGMGGSGGSEPVGMGAFPGCPGCVSLFDGKTLDGWHANSEKYDVVMDTILKKNVMRSTGAARGFLATNKSYQNFRFIFSNRLIATGHAQNMLLWCQQGAGMTYPNNACGGIQYQPPKGSMWDYRPGQNKSPAGKTSLGGSAGATNMEWTQCEIVAKGTENTFKVACCKLTPGAGPCKGSPIISWKDATGAGPLKGPVAWQAHNGGHVIHWTDVFIEENPASDDFITTK
jgi:hypothetical protein